MKKNIITNNIVVNFIKEAYQELKKVAWPKRKEVFSKTVIVVLSMVVIAAILGVLDLGLSQLTQIILGIKK